MIIGNKHKKTRIKAYLELCCLLRKNETFCTIVSFFRDCRIISGCSSAFIPYRPPARVYIFKALYIKNFLLVLPLYRHSTVPLSLLYRSSLLTLLQLNYHPSHRSFFSFRISPFPYRQFPIPPHQSIE